ncbi:putative cell wall protein [Sesbania bispinosa]|nr:putative cell wall protein [Sesbania bispinosa]
MAYKASSFLAFLLISNILLSNWQAVAGRNINPKNSKTQDKKEPQWFFNPVGGVYIPGIGRVGLPPTFGLTPQNPYTGGSGGAGSVPAGHSYVPGGDDTFVPNPGFEVPIPGSGGGVPAALHP